MTVQRQHLTPGLLLLLVLLTLGWGMNWPIMKIALRDVPVWTFRSFCVGAGAVGLLGLALLSGQRLRIPPGQLPRLLAAAAFNITGWNLLALYGLQHLPSGRAAILAFTMPVWATLLSLLVLDERLTARRAAGLVLGMSGMAILVGGDLRALGAAPLGSLLMLGAAVSWAIGVVLMKRLVVDLPPTALSGWQMLLGGAPIVAGALVLEWGAVESVSAASAAGVLYNMFVCFIFCYWAWFKIVASVPVAVSGLSTLLIPIVGVFSGMLILGERPGWPEFTAMALVVGAMATVLLPAAAPAPEPAAERS